MEAAADRRAVRTLGAAGVVAVTASITCGAVALTLDGGGEADTDPASVAVAVAPSTVAPRAVATSTSTLPGAATSTTVAAPVPPSTSPLSPLSDLVGDPVSMIPVKPVPDLAPVGVRIDGVLDGAPVIPVGVAPDGQLEIPGATEAGWYELGAAPGQPGATVIAAHVSWRGSLGPFARLGDVELGSAVTLTLADGSARTYQVIERAQHGKLMLPREEIWRTIGPETLVLITCGGNFNPDIRRYADNIVVTAVPIA